MRTLIFLLGLLVTSAASADPVVLAIDGAEVYVDVGALDGVGPGSELELLHEVVAKDPRTGAVLRDRFAIGKLTIIRSGARLSVASFDPILARRVLAGDVVRVLSAPRTFIDPWAAQVEASKVLAPGGGALPAPTPGTPGADHVALATRAWQDTLGQPPEKRIERWSALIAADPKTPYRKVIENEILSQQLQIKARDEALAAARSVRTDDRNPRIAHLAAELAKTGAPLAPGAVLAVAPLERAVPNRPIELSFLVRMPSAIAQAWLYVRPHGEPGFRRIELRPDGDAYLRATIAADAVRAGTLEWYVEARDAGVEQEVSPVLGSQAQPQVIEIDDTVTEAPIASGRSHIDAHVDYVDFDGGLGEGHDQYYQAEIDFTYRFLTPVYAVRLGFGTLAGKGGPRDIIDEDSTGRCLDGSGIYRCRKVNFSYVYTELEFKLRPNVALMIRPQAGLLTTDEIDEMPAGRCTGRNIAGCEFRTGFGARGRVRFGSEAGTNLVIGAAFSDKVGTLLEAAYHWLPTKIVPVKLTVQVTDVPVTEDFGVRLIADVGLRRLTWFYPSLRVSYQARDIDHSGVSGGLAMNFDW
jgi:hypothetical protein